LNVQILHIRACVCVYTGYSILNNALRFLENYGRYRKLFQTKVGLLSKYGLGGDIRRYHWFNFG